MLCIYKTGKKNLYLLLWSNRWRRWPSVLIHFHLFFVWRRWMITPSPPVVPLDWNCFWQNLHLDSWRTRAGGSLWFRTTTSTFGLWWWWRRWWGWTWRRRWTTPYVLFGSGSAAGPGPAVGRGRRLATATAKRMMFVTISRATRRSSPISECL